MSAFAASLRGPDQPDISRFWGPSFLLAVAAHILVAIMLLDAQPSAPDGGTASPDLFVEMSELPLLEALGDASGASDAVSPGAEVEVAGEADTTEPVETVEPEAIESSKVEALEPVPVEPLQAVTAEVAEPAPAEAVPLEVSEAAELAPAEVDAPPPVPSETLPPTDAESAPASAVAETAEAIPAEDVVAPASAPLLATVGAPAELSPAEAAEATETAPASSAMLAEAPGDILDTLTAAPIDSVTAEALAATPAPSSSVVTEADALTGEVTETAELAALPRPRPDAVPEAFLQEQERLREAEARRVAHAERQRETRRAETRAEERRAEDRRAAERRDRDRPAAEAPRRAASSGGAGASGSTRRDPGAGRAATSSYQDRVYAQLQRRKRFPNGAEGGGVVTVGFRVAASGSASGIRLVRSSGNPTLDQAALDLVRSASPFPPIPPEVGRSSLSFAVPISYARR